MKSPRVGNEPGKVRYTPSACFPQFFQPTNIQRYERTCGALEPQEDSVSQGFSRPGPRRQRWPHVLGCRWRNALWGLPVNWKIAARPRRRIRYSSRLVSGNFDSQSRRQYKPCVHARRGWTAAGALPALPRGKSPRRPRHDDDWRLGDDFARHQLGRWPARSLNDRIIPHLRVLSERIHRQGAAVTCQVSHLGRRATAYSSNWLPVLAPSRTRETRNRNFPKEMDHADIDRIVQDYADAAGVA